jgi:hypothetical protein
MTLATGYYKPAPMKRYIILKRAGGKYRHLFPPAFLRRNKGPVQIPSLIKLAGIREISYSRDGNKAASHYNNTV